MERAVVLLRQPWTHDGNTVGDIEESTALVVVYHLEVELARGSYGSWDKVCRWVVRCAIGDGTVYLDLECFVIAVQVSIFVKWPGVS
jgi:hypothetical protein